MAPFSLLLFVLIALISPVSSIHVSHKRLVPLNSAGWLRLSNNIGGTNSILNVRGGGGDKLKIKCLLRGKTYDMTAETVADVKNRVQKETGFSNIQVFFRGDELVDEDMTLVDAGIEKGDILSLKARVEKKKRSPTLNKLKQVQKSARSKLPTTGAAAAGTGGGIGQLMEGLGGKESMEKMMQQMGMEGSLTPEKMEEQMKSVLANPQVTQMLDNPLVMEQSRQQIMNNPAMMQMFESMGMGQVFKDPKAYAEHMGSVKEMLKDPELLKSLGSSPPVKAKDEDDDFDQGDM